MGGRRGARSLGQKKTTTALLLRRVAVGEADLMLTLLTEHFGLVGAVARSARRSNRRFSSLEPMHRLRITMDVKPGRDVANLVEATIDQMRLSLIGDLERMECAGRVLRWTRKVASPSESDADVWGLVDGFLDTLDHGTDEPRISLAVVGLQLTTAAGWGLSLSRCAKCGRACPEDRPSCIDGAAGGLVCRQCGGARLVIGPEIRSELSGLQLGLMTASAQTVELALDLIESTLQAHAGVGL